MASYTQVRCLFCKTGSEREVVRTIHDRQLGRALFGERVKLYRYGREREEEIIKPLLPGYVFVYALEGSPPEPDFSGVDGVIRVLDYGKKEEAALRGRDREFADWLWTIDGRVEAMEAVQEGDHVTITDELFKKLHGTIVHVDTRKKSVKVRLETEAMAQYLTLSYKLVKKTAADEP